ncbi:putative ribonuclease H protein [Glycine max]|nr:putative ribonuclease H protein [Glycine max]
MINLAFIDDIMLLSRGDIPSVSTMFAKLQHFYRVSGLSISYDKSAIYSAGKLELIRAVIQGIVNLWMKIFPLPQSVLDRINASCRNFLWGKADIDKNKPLVTWSVVCSPKKEGGLGLFNLKD